MTINYERRHLPPHPSDEAVSAAIAGVVPPQRPYPTPSDDPTGGYARLQAAVKADEQRRRAHVEELTRAAIQLGWALGWSGEPMPEIDMTWDEDGNAHVHARKQPARQPLLTRIFGARRTSL